MVHKIFNWFFSCFFILVTACSDSLSQEIRFHPKKGDIYEYTAQIIVEANIKTKYGQQSDRLTSSILSRYEVLSVSNNTAKIELKPEIFDINSSSTTDSFYSRSADEEDKFTHLMKDGFIFEVDLKTGNTISIQANNKKIWQEVLAKDTGKTILNTLNKQLSIPAITTSIPKTTGAVIELKSFQGVNDITLKVESITNDEALLILNGKDNHKNYGQLIVDVNTGWPKKIAMVAETPLQVKDMTGTAQIFMNIQQGRKNFVEADNISIYMMSISDPSMRSYGFCCFKQEANKPLTEADVFPSSTGMLNVNGTAFYLNYKNDPYYYLAKGSYKIVEMKLLSNQLPIKMDLLQVQKYTDYYHDIVLSEIYTPVVWSVAEKLLESITAVKAKVAYYPYEKKPFTFKLNTSQPTTINAMNTSITFIPDDSANTFLVTMQSTDHNWMDLKSMKSSNTPIMPQVTPIDDRYEWMGSIEEKFVKNTKFGILKANQYKVIFKELPTEEITIDVINLADTPLYQKEITFSPQ